MYYYARKGGKGHFPFISEGAGTAIGEILTFTDWDQAIEYMDELERHPGWYTRKITEVTTADGVVKAWVYWMHKEHGSVGQKIESGDFIVDIAL